MPAAIPLIRGFALLPTLHWLADEGVSIERALAEVDLSLSPINLSLPPDTFGARGRSASERCAGARARPSLPYCFKDEQPRDCNARKGCSWRANAGGSACEDRGRAAVLLLARAGVVREEGRPIRRAGVLRPRVRPRDEAHAPAVRHGHDRSHPQHGGQSSASICEDRNSPASYPQGGAPSALVRRPCDWNGVRVESRS